MMSGRVDHWIRLECLADDSLKIMSNFVTITSEQEATVRAMQPSNTGDYDRNLSQWFSHDDLRRVYKNNPVWADIERQVYGNTLINAEANAA